MPVKSAHATLYRVRIGPMKDRASAEATLRDVKIAERARGSRGASVTSRLVESARRECDAVRIRALQNSPRLELSGQSASITSLGLNGHDGAASRVMNGADYLILGVLFVSMLLGMFRGFVREAIGCSRGSAACGSHGAMRRCSSLYLGGMLGEPPVSTWAARALIVMAVLVSVGWSPSVLGYLLRHSALSVMVDRLLGSVLRRRARRRRRRGVRAARRSSRARPGRMVEALAAAAVCERSCRVDPDICGNGHEALEEQAQARRARVDRCHRGA